MEEMIKIPKQRYYELIECERTDKEFVLDIVKGLNDILQGKIKEV